MIDVVLVSLTIYVAKLSLIGFTMKWSNIMGQQLSLQDRLHRKIILKIVLSSNSVEPPLIQDGDPSYEESIGELRAENEILKSILHKHGIEIPTKYADF